MVYREHLVELWVNGQKVELESQKSLNLRFNNVLFDPTKIASTNGEYSFEFDIPSTPKNDKIFDYANNLSKLNKFHTRWDAELYADGNLIFNGSLTLNSYKNKRYKANLVSVKNYSLDEIFGDGVMTDIPWSVPFEGVGSSDVPYTIDWYNASHRNDVCFPLISYGVFQKSAIDEDVEDDYKEYTSKFDLDKYNRWYVESFAPSINMVETLKKAFEWKGYTVGGDVLTNEYLNEIFMSVNLADGQAPTYNLGNQKFGKVDLNVEWTTPINGSAYTQSLNFPYCRIGGYMEEDGKFLNHSWNFDEVQVYDMLSEGTVNVASSSYLYQPNEHIIVIPADGFYKITLSGNCNILTNSELDAEQWVQPWLSMNKTERRNVKIPPDIRKYTPIEIQLVRNYDDNIELIKGDNNFYLADGNPKNTTQCDAGYNTNYYSRYSCFPHEKCGSCFYYGDTAALNGSAGAWLYAPPTDITRFGDELNRNLYNFEEGNNMGYLYNNGDIMAYDPVVNKDFILGFTTMGSDDGGGCSSVIKNGYSWSKTISERYDALYPQISGYWKANTGRRVDKVPDWNITTTPSDHNKNYYNGSNNFFAEHWGGSKIDGIVGQIECLVHLNKNDVLQLMAVQREYVYDGDQEQYSYRATYNLSIEAISPKSYDAVRNYTADAPTEFDTELRLSNFFNKEKKVSEWVQNIADAFNLEIVQDGKNVNFNTKRKLYSGIITAVDIDDRVNSAEAEASIIDYPKSMAVKYKIDSDEWGAEKSVIDAYGEDKMNDPNWKDFIDKGYDVINLNDDSYVTNTSDKELQFSYTWYDNFDWYEVDYNGQQNPYVDPILLRMPCISKYSYMIDGYSYQESMKHDGYGLTQRFWFRPKATNCYVWTETYPRQSVNIYVPRNLSDDENLNLSYKTSEKSLLSRFFNISSYLASNYVIVDVYLNPSEYNRIKNGCLVHFDSDLYIPVEIDGYDVSGYNPTTLKMMKKVV